MRQHAPSPFTEKTTEARRIKLVTHTGEGQSWIQAQICQALITMHWGSPTIITVSMGMRQGSLIHSASGFCFDNLNRKTHYSLWWGWFLGRGLLLITDNRTWPWHLALSSQRVSSTCNAPVHLQCLAVCNSNKIYTYELIFCSLDLEPKLHFQLYWHFELM